MTKEVKYPVKYAVLELKERGGWSSGYEYITQGFIVSKCYVVESKIIYRPDGSNKIMHSVVFPFADIDCFKSLCRQGRDGMGIRQIPSYDAADRPYPISIVDNLYDSYEEAKVAAEEKNEDYRINLIIEISMLQKDWQKQYEDLKKEFNKRLELCYLFEEKTLGATKDMEVSNQTMDNDTEFVRILKPHN